MTLFRNIVFVSALAGLVAGLAMTAMQYAGTVPLILQAETYETAEPPRLRTTMGPPADGRSGVAAHSHEHDDEAWAPTDGFQRSAFTALANIVTAIGFAILLVTASEFAGGLTGWRQGMFWGLGGLCGLHARTRPRASARTSGNAGGRSRCAAGLVGRDRCGDGCRAWPCWPSRGCCRWRCWRSR